MSAPGGSSDPPAVKDRWWVDTGEKKRERAQPPAMPVGSRFYRSSVGFDQETARARLTDLNLKLLEAANPEEGTWGYVKLAEKPHQAQNRDRITAQLAMPPHARGVVVDCGRTLRLLVTGSPMGERVLDLTLGDPPSFDAWIAGDWVRERVFRDQRSALAAFKRLIAEFLSPEAIATWQSLRAQL
ncbi:MAG: hypothetical protein AB7V27_09205 [Candidatus Binatia bacterium]